MNLAAKSVQSTSLAFESVHYIHGRYGLSLGVLCVGHSITDDILKKDFENTTGLFVNQARDTLHTATASKTTDGWLGYALDVVPQYLAVAFRTSFPETFTSFTPSRHYSVASLDKHLLSSFLSSKEIVKVNSARVFYNCESDLSKNIPLFLIGSLGNKRFLLLK